MRTVRRLGIALGSLVAASLVVGLVGGVLFPAVGVIDPPGGELSATPSNIATTLVVVILGALIYRDIIRREQRSS